jgi:hypothetical protein
LLSVPFADFESKWAEIETYLAPRFLLKPALRKFAPDLGLALTRLGLAPDATVTMLGVRLNFFSWLSDKLITASSGCHFVDRLYMASFDFAPELLAPMIDGLPPPLAEAFRSALSCYPFQAYADLLIEVDLDMKFGDPVNGKEELFVPLVITKVFGSRLNPELVPDHQTYPSEVFRLKDALGNQFLTRVPKVLISAQQCLPGQER